MTPTFQSDQVSTKDDENLRVLYLYLDSLCLDLRCDKLTARAVPIPKVLTGFHYGA